MKKKCICDEVAQKMGWDEARTFNCPTHGVVYPGGTICGQSLARLRDEFYFNAPLPDANVPGNRYHGPRGKLILLKRNP